MKNTIFVQFYSKWRMTKNIDVWGISNGFSDTYDFCKSKGDFFWVHHNFDNQRNDIKDMVATCKEKELPIKKRNVFISATTTSHVYQGYYWAKKYPNINFIVGGPAITTKTFTYNSLPKNIIFVEKSLEQFFNIEDFSYEWKLELPEQTIKDDRPIFLVYSISSRCYWNKCLFCKFDINKDRTRKIFDFKFKDNINSNKPRSIFLYTPSMTPAQLSYLVPRLPRKKNLRYTLFLRSSKKENEILEEVLKKCSNGEGPHPNNITFQIGLEFPGNRMLNYMRKGTTTNDILNTMKIIKKYKSRIYMSLILGWPNLTEQDIKEVKQFIKDVPKYDKDTHRFMRIWRLFARVGTPLYDMVEKEHPRMIGPFYSGSGVKISDKALTLNLRARNLLLSLDNVADNYTPTLVDNYENIFNKQEQIIN